MAWIIHIYYLLWLCIYESIYSFSFHCNHQHYKCHHRLYLRSKRDNARAPSALQALKGMPVPTWDLHGQQACPFCMIFRAKRYLLPFWNTGRVYMFPLLVADECGALLDFPLAGVLGRDCVIGGAVGQFCWQKEVAWGLNQGDGRSRCFGIGCRRGWSGCRQWRFVLGMT
jgi:hypothetical protein